MEKVKKLIVILLLLQVFAFGNDLLRRVQDSVVDYLLSKFTEQATVTNLQFKQEIPQADSFEILSHSLSAGKVNVLIKFLKDGSFCGYVQATAYISVLRNVLVACRTIKSGEIIRQEDLSVVEMDVFGKNGQFTDRLEDVVGKLSKKMIRQGDPVDILYLAKVPDVKAGQVLPATIQIGSVMVTTFVRVVQDGSFGEIVKARNLSTGFLIQGILKEDYSIYVPGS